MKTLKDLVIEAKCRKGPATGTTKRGAFWNASEPVQIRLYGGDGIGQSSPDIRHRLSLRHYRDGTVSAVVRYSSWHQNGPDSTSYHPVDSILGCTTIEEVIVALKGEKLNISDGYYDVPPVSVYSDRWEPELTEFLAKLGLPTAAPAPDEEAAR